MTKFASIWGDLDVGNITEKAAPVNTDKPVEDLNKEKAPKEEEKPKLPVDEEDIEKKEDKPLTEEEKIEKAKAEEEEEEEEVAYSEEEISKAFTMLDDEGVLDLKEEDEFEQTVPGLADAVAATVRNKLEAEIAAIPEVVQQFYGHVIEGNDPSSFKITTPVVWADANTQDENTQKLALKQFYVNQNMTSEEADEEIEDIIAAGKLEKKSATAITSLVKTQETQTEAREAAETERSTKATKSKQDDIKAIEKIIDDSDEYVGFKMDDARKKEFKDYLFKVQPRTGKTQMQINMANEDRRLEIAFLDFVNYTKADLTKEVADGLTKKRKKKLTRYTDKNVANKNNSASVKTKADGTKGKIKFPSIFGNTSIEVED